MVNRRLAVPVRPNDPSAQRPGRVEQSRPAAKEAKEEPDHPWRQKTDPAGLFAFPTVPSGDWLVVAVRVAPYAAEKLRAAPKPRQSTRTQGFLPRTTGPAKEVELWVTRIHVVKGERVALGPHRPGALAGRADPLGAWPQRLEDAPNCFAVATPSYEWPARCFGVDTGPGRVLQRRDL